MRQATFTDYRRRVVPAAEGRVLEIGIGSGLNLPFYGGAAQHIVGLDPSPKLLELARRAAKKRTLPIELLEASAEAIPLDDRSIDTIVTTWTLCSVANVVGALADMRRVLTPHGRLLFVEHGRSPDAGISRWQDRLTPLWKRIGGGCHLNRPIDRLLEASGFRIEQIDTSYMEGPKIFTFMYEGSARAA